MSNSKNALTAVTVVCPFCGSTFVVRVPSDGYAAWKNGACIQDVMPDVDPDIREMLISGICPDCWDNMFWDDEDENEDEYYEDYDCDSDFGFDPYMGCFTGDC